MEPWGPEECGTVWSWFFYVLEAEERSRRRSANHPFPPVDAHYTRDWSKFDEGSADQDNPTIQEPLKNNTTPGGIPVQAQEIHPPLSV